MSAFRIHKLFPLVVQSKVILMGCVPIVDISAHSRLQTVTEHLYLINAYNNITIIYLTVIGLLSGGSGLIHVHIY